MARLLNNSYIFFAILLVLNVGLESIIVEADVSAIFIFGDSTVDVGTNNYLHNSLARADQAYNGIDFPFSEATGRFSNGYNTADFLVRLMSDNYERSPGPFLNILENNSTFKRDITFGANFASGGSGILNTTGKTVFINVVSLGEQIQQFSTAITNMTDILGHAKADELVKNSVYVVSVGSNDLFDYQLSNFSTATIDTFIANLNDTFANQLKDLYNLGARKFGIIGVPPIGCCPYERFLYGDGFCFEKMNDLANAFYASTESLLQEFSSQFSGVVYSLGNAYQMAMDIIHNPLASGFKNVKAPCCGNETFSTVDLGLCTPSENLCMDRDDYLFWDWYHPTEAAARLAALSLYGGESPFVTPMNFSRLVFG